MSVNWIPIPSGYDPKQIMGYQATVPGCRLVSVRSRDVRCDGWNGIEWEVALDEHKWQPSNFSARGIAKDLEQGKQAAEKALDLAVALWLLAPVLVEPFPTTEEASPWSL